MEKPELDLTESKCHVCGNPMWKNIENKTERCLAISCSAKNVDFSIRVKQDLNK